MSPPPLTRVPAAATADGGAVVLQDTVGVAAPVAAGVASPVECLLQGGRLRALFTMLGPAFVAAVAYVDPGNFATNIQGGARFGYALLWVVVLANAMAMLIQYLSAKLGNPTRDPHGDPIPTRDLTIDEQPTEALCELEPGATGTFTRISDSDPDMLRFLAERGIAPGATFEVIDKQPFDGPLFVQFGDEVQVLGGSLTRAMRAVVDR